MILIRRMIIEDIKQIQSVAQQTWNATYGGIIPIEIQKEFLEVNYSDLAMRNRLERSIVFVAELGNEIVGFANFFRSKKNDEEAQLAAIYILPEAQGKGIGTELLGVGINELEGIKYLYVTIENKNENGKRFYASKGFKVISDFDEELNGHIIQCSKMCLSI